MTTAPASPARPAHWLVTPGGIRLAITPSGVLIGRGAHCDVVSTEPQASRVQAIVFAGPSGPALTVLGKAATAVNGQPVARDRELADGDRIELPGVVLDVIAEVDATAAPPASTWVVRGPGGLFGVVRSPFTVGGARGSDLCIDGAAPALIRFHIADRLYVEAVVPIAIDGVDHAAGELEALPTGATITCAGHRFDVVAGGSLGQGSTAGAADADDGPTRVRLAFLARGGRLTVAGRSGERSVYLPERRCDLVAMLLSPPAPYRAGDFVPDDVLLPRLWPGKTMTRGDLNVVLHRARHDLVRAGLDGAALLARAEGGNATAFRLGRDAAVIVE